MPKAKPGKAPRPGRAPTVVQRASNDASTEDERLLSVSREDLARSESWRVLRIMGEFVEGIDALAGLGKAVTIFGSSRIEAGAPIYESARETARLLGERGYAVITGGGPGIMEAANRGAREAGARSVGLNIELPYEQALNAFVELSIEFRYFFVRKVMLTRHANAFLIFPGGFGTADEMFEALVLLQTGKVRNFPVILFGSSYWRGLLDWLRGTALQSGTISSADLDLLAVADSPEEVRELVIRYSPERTSRERAARESTRRILRRRR